MKATMISLPVLFMCLRLDAQPSRRTAGMEGDGAGPMASAVDPVRIPEADSPIEELAGTASDGRAARALWRKPKGEGPFPAVVIVHGGLRTYSDKQLKWLLTGSPVITRLLAAGYATVAATYRTYEQEVQSRGPIEDVRAVVQALSREPAIDRRRIALFGGSGGGNIALELGSEPLVRAVVAGEPATILYTGMLTTGDYQPRLEIMADPGKFFTPELRQKTLAKLRTLRAPVLILHSDQHDLRKMNAPLFIPLMREAGASVEYREYPGYGHGFYFGGGATRLGGKGADEQVVAAVVRDVAAFLERSFSASAAPAPAAAAGQSGAGTGNSSQPAEGGQAQ